jgi:hypothetical protein
MPINSRRLKVGRWVGRCWGDREIEQQGDAGARLVQEWILYLVPSVL